jgi:valyl-tRNA synthetase
VEPLLSTQWFVKMKPLAEPAIEAVRDGRIKIVPERFEKVYFNWMENIRDWCISRQLWWGHRIPVWYGPDGHQFVERSASEAKEKAIKYYGDCVKLEQDPDVLDTWFSSGLWPFSTLGWPQQTSDLARFYPTSVLETGYDIIFFWVARMIVMGLKFTGEAPFRVVYLHGLVRDETGRKMSKSLGNVLDPLDLIKDYGTDALRFTLLTGGTPGNDMKLSLTRIEANRNFANKIWNAARFVVMNLSTAQMEFDNGDAHSRTYALPNQEGMTLADRWILSRLTNVQSSVTRLVDDWQIGEAGRQIYEFLWNEYCDWYIEATKSRLYGADAVAAQTARQVLAYVLDQSLRLLHPYMPFVTEAIWRHLPGIAEERESLMTSRWPVDTRWADAEVEDGFGRLQEIIRAIRNVRSEYNVEPARRITAIFNTNGYTDLLRQNVDLLVSQARLAEDDLQMEPSVAAPEQAVALTAGGVSVYLPLAGMVDLEAERQRLQKELDNVTGQIDRSEKLLGNPGFVAKAPEEVINRERAKIVELKSRREQIQANLAEM